MASAIGAPFVRACSMPLRIAASKLNEGRLFEGLEALSKENLQQAFGDGVDATARSLAVPRERVLQALPVAELQHALEDVARCQLAARSSVSQFAGTLGSDLSTSDEPASQRLLGVAAKYALDAHIANPVRSLAEAVAHCEACVDRAGLQLSTDPALRAVRARKRLLLVAAALGVLAVILAAAGIGAWHHVVVTGARDRVAAIVALPDPCSCETVADADLEHARPNQKQHLEAMKNACAANRRREAHIAACDILASHVESGSLNESDKGTAGSAHALLRRIAVKDLRSEDLTIGPDAMPCADTPSHDRLWKSFTGAATQSASLWGEVESISDHVRSLLIREGVSLSPQAKETLVHRVEAVTKRAITTGLEPELARARRLCTLVDQLGYEKKPWCKALDRIEKR